MNMRIFLLLVLVGVVCGQQCSGKLDVIFARDSSYGLGSGAEWDAQYNLQITMVSKLGLSANGIHVGIVDYGNIAKTRLPFTYEVQNVIETLQKWPWYDTSYCYPDSAINQSISNFESSGRIGVPRMIVFFSATHADDNSKFISEATTAKVGDDIIIMVVAADQADPQTLQSVVSLPEMYFYAQTFQSLVPQVPSILSVLCNYTNSSTSTSGNSGSNSNSGNSLSGNSNSGNSNSGNSGNSNSGNSNSGNSNSGNSNSGNSNSGNSNSGNSNGNSGNSNSGNSNGNSGNSNGNSGNSNGNSGNSNGNSGNSNSGNSGNGNSGNGNSGNSGNSGSSSSSSSSSATSGSSCGLNTCPQGDICCSDGSNPSNPYYCCAGGDQCCVGTCCNAGAGYHCYSGACAYGKKRFNIIF